MLLLPVRESVLFPGVVLPFLANRPMVEAALQEAARSSRTVAVVLQRDASVETPGLAALHPIGTEGRLLRYVSGRDGAHHAIVQGTSRIRVLDMVDGSEPRTVRVQRMKRTRYDRRRDRRAVPAVARSRTGGAGADGAVAA